MNNKIREVVEEYCRKNEISFSKVVNDTLVDFIKKKGIEVNERNGANNS